MRTDTLGVHLGGTTGKAINLEPIPLYGEDGQPNEKNIATAAALRQGSYLDRVTMGLSMTGISIPVFVVAPLFVLLFAVTLRWLPAGWSGADGAARLVVRRETYDDLLATDLG